MGVHPLERAGVHPQPACISRRANASKGLSPCASLGLVRTVNAAGNRAHELPPDSYKCGGNRWRVLQCEDPCRRLSQQLGVGREPEILVKNVHEWL